MKEGGTLDVGLYSITASGAIQLNGYLKTANPAGLTGSTATSLAPGIVLNTTGVNSIIEYNAPGNQSVSALPAYANLVISDSGNKALTGLTTVTNNLELKGGLPAIGCL